MIDTLRLRTRTADRLPYTAVDALLFVGKLVTSGEKDVLYY